MILEEKGDYFAHKNSKYRPDESTDIRMTDRDTWQLTLE